MWQIMVYLKVLFLAPVIVLRGVSLGVHDSKDAVSLFKSMTADMT